MPLLPARQFAWKLSVYFKMRGYIPSCSPKPVAISLILKWPLSANFKMRGYPATGLSALPSSGIGEEGSRPWGASPHIPKFRGHFLNSEMPSCISPGAGAKPAELVGALGLIEIAPGRAQHARRRGEAAAAQHAVLIVRTRAPSIPCTDRRKIPDRARTGWRSTPKHCPQSKRSAHAPAAHSHSASLASRRPAQAQ